MKRERLMQRLNRAWNDIQASYAGLPDEHLTEPGLAGAWSVKDVLAHITTWEAETLQHLPHILAGGRPPRYSVVYGGLDAFNDLMTAQKRALPLGEVRRQLAETHQQLLDYLASVPDEPFEAETRFRRRLRLDTYSHYPLHTRMIQAWRQGLAE
jgi:hypothetical protein